MDKLAIELIDLISDQCDVPSLKNLRLVDTTLRDAIAPHLFETFYMALFDESIDKLVSLAGSPLAKHVKRLVCLTDVLPNWTRASWNIAIDCLFRPDWETVVRRRGIPRNGFDYIRTYDRIQDVLECPLTPEGGGPAYMPLSSLPEPQKSLSASELDMGWNEFDRLRRAQRDWRQDVQGLVFKETFATLPNAVEVESMRSISGENRFKMMGESDFWVCDYWDVRSAASGLVSLCLLEAIGFRASLAGTNSVSKLLLHTMHDESFMKLIETSSSPSSDRSMMQQHSTFHTLKDGFHHLTDIQLRVDVDFWTKNTPISFAAEFATLLGASRQVRRLTIFWKEGIWGGQPRGHSSIQSTKLFAWLAYVPELWPHIQHLSLAIDVGNVQLLSLLRQLAPSLRSLELRDMAVSDVHSLFQEIPTTLKLDHLYVKSIGHSTPDEVKAGSLDPYTFFLPDGTDVEKPQVQAVKQYLLRERDGFPDLTGLSVMYSARPQV